METKVRVSDNSGVKLIKCITSGKPGVLTVGDVFKASVISVKSRRKVKKGQVWRCLLIRVRKIHKRLVGVYVGAASNTGILIRKTELTPYANRMKTPAFIELRKYGFVKVLSMTRLVI